MLHTVLRIVNTAVVTVLGNSYLTELSEHMYINPSISTPGAVLPATLETTTGIALLFIRSLAPDLIQGNIQLQSSKLHIYLVSLHAHHLHDVAVFSIMEIHLAT